MHGPLSVAVSVGAAWGSELRIEDRSHNLPPLRRIFTVALHQG